MNKLLFTLPLVLILIPIANAEEITINIPFDSHGYNCELVDTSEELRYTCIFEGNVRTLTLDELKKFEAILTEEEINEAIETIEKLELQKIEQSKITENDRLILKLEKKVNGGWYDTNELVLLHMLYDLEMCYQGLGRSAVTQDYREFEISNYINYKNNHVEIKNKLGELAKSMEECYAQQKLEYIVFSEQYNNMAVGENDVNFSLLEHFEGVQAVPFEKYTSTSKEIDMSVICDNNQHSQQYKNLMNCPKPVYDGDMTDKTNGFITYYSSALQKHGEFMQEYGSLKATQSDKQEEELKASKILEEILKENSWYYR